MQFLFPTEIPNFPNPETANEYGLLAVNGSLSPSWLLNAYSKGIFPWFSKNEPILWFSPNPRAIMAPGDLIIHKSMHSILNNSKFELRIDFAFKQVMIECAKPRINQAETWILPEMIEAYTKLHQLGYAHSFEAWENNNLVGALYGVSLGKIFFGESMFASVNNASKFAFIKLCQFLEENNFTHIDCQVESKHLTSLGCKSIPRSEFIKLISINNNFETKKGNWSDLL